MARTKKTKAELEQQIVDLSAQLVHRYKSAKKELDGAGETLTASAAVIRITGLGGREIVAPVAIINGLSKETIQALRNDLQRSFDHVAGVKTS